MRLYKYLSELDAKTHDFQPIITNCSKFLKEWKNVGKTDFILKRGSKNGTSTYKQYNTNKNRRPLDTDISVHDTVDKIYKQNLGVALRSSSVFTTTDQSIAGEYGIPYGFIPIGDYKLFQNPVLKDMYIDLNPMDWYAPNIVTKFSKLLSINVKDVLKQHKLIADARIFLRASNIFSANPIDSLYKKIYKKNYRLVLQKDGMYKLKETDSNKQNHVLDKKLFVELVSPIVDDIKNAFINLFKKTKQVSLKEASQKPNEVMVDCESYYLCALSLSKNILRAASSEIV